MPSRRTADRGALGLIAGDGNIEEREMRHFRGMIRGEAERDWSAPIVTDYGETRVAEMIMHELPDVVGDSFFLVAGDGARGIAEAAQIRGDQRELVGEQRHQMAPFVPSLRPSVEQDDRRALPCRDEMDSHAIEIGVEMRKFSRHRGSLTARAT